MGEDGVVNNRGNIASMIPSILDVECFSLAHLPLYKQKYFPHIVSIDMRSRFAPSSIPSLLLLALPVVKYETAEHTAGCHGCSSVISFNLSSWSSSLLSLPATCDLCRAAQSVLEIDCHRIEQPGLKTSHKHTHSHAHTCWQ